jgi:RNA polymerase sigma-70 factor, ECF subfamily
LKPKRNFAVALSADSVFRIPLSDGISAENSDQPSDLEQKTVALFEELRVPLLRYLSSLGISVHNAEEVVQEVFLNLFTHLRNHNHNENLRGWIFRVAHNLGLKQRKQDQKWQNLSDWSWEGADLSSNPEQQAVDEQRQRRLLAVVNALPEQDRYCLNLRAEGLSYREIASVLGISLGSVSLSLSRSFARLSRADEK